MLDKDKCEVLLKQRENEVSDSDIYLRILKNVDDHIASAKYGLINPFKRKKALAEKKAQLDKVRQYVSMKFGIEKFGQGEDSEIGFLICFESHIKSLKADIEVLKKYLDAGEEFESLPSSKYDKGRYKLISDQDQSKWL